MKLSLTYVALNTDVVPPVLTTEQGFTVVASPSAIEQMRQECERVLDAIKKLPEQPEIYTTY